jgi:hypothetical protein
LPLFEIYSELELVDHFSDYYISWIIQEAKINYQISEVLKDSGLSDIVMGYFLPKAKNLVKGEFERI